MGDTGIIGGTRQNGMVIDLMKLGGQTWQLHLHIIQHIMLKIVRKVKEIEGTGLFSF